MLWLKKIRNKYRKHVFDLEKPYKVKEVLGYTFPTYKCKNCDREMSLDLWQMKLLPPSMLRGCERK